MLPLKVGVAMSGGVDSAMAASLLQQRGNQVHGFFMQLPLPKLAAHQQRAQEVAASLSIPLALIDLRRQFSEQVIASFTTSYQAGLTPNPCIHCNQAIKFDLLAQAMLVAGMDRIATGHYARILHSGDVFFIGRGRDRVKDQSYFLARLSSAQLHKVDFPLGDWTKQQVYERARGLGLQCTGEESQDICFLTDGLASFLAGQGVREQSGPVLTLDGRQIGDHRGVWHYTIGQRRGLGLPDATPWYVVALDGSTNKVFVGKQPDLLHTSAPLHSLTWTGMPPPLPWRGLVQLRSRHTPALAQLSRFDATTWKLVFDAPQRAITPGQYAVFYEDDRVLGNAVIGAIAPMTTGEHQ